MSFSLGYWRQVLQVSGGVVFGQLLGILGYVALTWLYGPAEFGTYAGWLALVALGSVVSTGALETTLVQVADEGSRKESAILVLYSAALGSLLYTLCCVFIAYRWITLPDMGTIWLFLATLLGVFSLAAAIVLQSWSAAEGRFRSLTMMRIVQSAFVVLAPLLLSLLGRSSKELIVGHAAGLFVTAIMWLCILRPAGKLPERLRSLPGFWLRNRRCFKFVLPALVVGACVANLPQLVANARFGNTAAGYMALAQRVLGTPLTLIGTAVRDVFKRFASVAYRERGECVAEFRNSLAVLSAASICFALVIAFFAEELFVLVFGAEWRTAGTYATLLLPMSAIGIAASPLSYLIYIVQREEFDLLWQSVLVCLVAAAWLLMPTMEGALRVYALAYASMYVVYLIACWNFSKGRDKPERKT